MLLVESVQYYIRNTFISYISYGTGVAGSVVYIVYTVSPVCSNLLFPIYCKLSEWVTFILSEW